MTRKGKGDPSAARAWEARWLAIGGMLALAGAMGIGRFVYTPILPPMSEALGQTASQSGLIASANYLGYLLGALLAALPGLPGGSRRWLVAGLIASALMTMAMALPSAMAAFLALRFIGGGASAIVIIFASSLVLERLTEMGHSRLTAVHFSGVGLGIAISAASTSAVLAMGGDWRDLWLVAGIVAVLVSSAAVVLVPNRPRHDKTIGSKGGKQGTAAKADRRAFFAYVVGYGLFGIGYVVTATFLVAIVRSEAALQASEPYIWLALGIAAIPSVALWTLIAARTSIATAFVLACLLEAVGVVSSVLWISPTGVFVSAILLGGTFMGLTALGLAGVRQSAPDRGHRPLALASASFGIGQMIGPLAAGLIADRTGGFLLPSLLAAGALMLGATIVACGTKFHGIRPLRSPLE